MSSSKTSEGEKQRGKHGVQMCLSKFKREAIVDVRQRQRVSTAIDSTKECGSYQRPCQTSEVTTRPTRGRNRTG